MNTATIRAQSLKRAIDRLDTLNVDTNSLLQRFGFDRNITSNPLKRVSFDRFVEFYEAAAQLAADPQLGLHIGEHTELDHYDTLGYAARCCDTFGAALQTLCRYLRVLEDGSQAYLTVDSTEARLCYQLLDNPPDSGRQTTELGLCVFHRWGEALLQSDWPLIEVNFTHTSPTVTDEYNRVFSCDVQFGQLANELIFSATTLQTALNSADPHLRSMMEDNLQHVAGSLPDDDWIANVRYHILSTLHQGEPSLTSLCRQMGVSNRTLQRRLNERSSGFALVLDAVRRDLAASELHRGQSSGEVAFALGYGDVSAFHHAFKRWYGMTPRQFQHRKLSSQRGAQDQ